jgi:hypothetical protein
MSKTIKRLLWQHTLRATVLRHPLPPAPMLAPESEPERAPAKRTIFSVRVNGEPVEVVKKWVPVPDGPCTMVLGTVPAGTLKVGEPLRVQELVDAYIAAITGAPGEVGHMKAFQRHHLGEPYPYKVGIDGAGGDDITSVALWERGGVHEGGWRLVGEGGPELELSHPGWSNLSGTLELEARLAKWQRNLDSDGEGDACD